MEFKTVNSFEGPSNWRFLQWGDIQIIRANSEENFKISDDKFENQNQYFIRQKINWVIKKISIYNFVNQTENDITKNIITLLKKLKWKMTLDKTEEL